MSRPAPGRLLLDLLASEREPDIASLAELSETGWAELASLAKLHRLEPQLYAQHRMAEFVPAALVARWREAHRRSALVAMAQAADLDETCGLLAAQGFAPLALKGAFLAHHCYPEAAQRPMRDIDLLVPEDQVLAAYQCLISAGYRPLEESKIGLADHARLEQHLPPLACPRGTVLELHMRLSERDGRLEYATPDGDEAGVIARAVTIGGIRYPAPTDMLAHLVTHAVYGHRFDCGPLLLGDVRWLAGCHPVDWGAFWDRAHRQQWSGGARLVIELVRSYHGRAIVPHHPAEPAEPDPGLVDLARDLLVQDHTAKGFARILATIRAGGWAYLGRRLSGTVVGDAEAPVTIERGRDGGRIAWTLRQLGTAAREFARAPVRRQARDLARFQSWLDSEVRR